MGTQELVHAGGGVGVLGKALEELHALGEAAVHGGAGHGVEVDHHDAHAGLFVEGFYGGFGLLEEGIVDLEGGDDNFFLGAAIGGDGTYVFKVGERDGTGVFVTLFVVVDVKILFGHVEKARICVLWVREINL